MDGWGKSQSTFVLFLSAMLGFEVRSMCAMLAQALWLALRATPLAARRHLRTLPAQMGVMSRQAQTRMAEVYDDDNVLLEFFRGSDAVVGALGRVLLSPRGWRCAK